MPSDNSALGRGRFLSAFLGTGLVLFYVLFTLLLNSNSLMVKWPWVLWWQLGLALGPILLIVQLWQQKSLRWLGNKLDWLMSGWILCLGLNVLFSNFAHQAGWYAWAAICAIAIIYALNQWLTNSARVNQLLRLQGFLVISFATLSLTLWTVQTALPYLNKLENLKSYGISKSFDWQILSIRNWYPLGHQNYVAGYLLLSIPLLVGLSILHRGRQRIFWCLGISVSFVCLYTTASRGSLLGLTISAATFLAISAWRYPQRRKLLCIIAIVCLVGLVLWGLSNDRLRTLFFSIFDSENQEITYRVITNVTGWRMGLDHLFFGAGLGNVALLYQKYLPFWAGQSAELTHQLHSTPAQVWAELGLVGSLLALVSLCLLIYFSFRWLLREKYTCESFWIAVSLCSGLIGYFIYSLTDYQLDNICISGTLIIFASTLIFYFRENVSEQQRYTIRWFPLSVAGISLLVVASFWLYPIHRAWMLSSQGFAKLSQKDIAGFVNKLETAHQLAPWEPYYTYQLGWNLGELAYRTTDLSQREALQGLSRKWFETAIATSPYQEFGYSNLGWLLVNTDPQKAVAAFAQAAQLSPSKKGSFFALGYALLNLNQSDLAIQAFSLELLEDPLLLTSPIWQTGQLKAIFPNVLSTLERDCTDFIHSADSSLQLYFYQLRGSLHWWLGNFSAAQQDFHHTPSSFNDLLMALSDGERPTELSQNKPTTAAITAWLHPDIRENTFATALLLSYSPDTVHPPGYLVQLKAEIIQSAQASQSFHQWLTQKAPARHHRNQRLGFGVISRHIDGPLPSDFSPRLDNVLMTQFFQDLFPEKTFDLNLEAALAPLKNQLIDQML
jgi:uncharacterized protein involved in response to NO